MTLLLATPAPADDVPRSEPPPGIPSLTLDLRLRPEPDTSPTDAEANAPRPRERPSLLSPINADSTPRQASHYTEPALFATPRLASDVPPQDTHDDTLFDLAEPDADGAFSFRVGRTTSLQDGGIEGSRDSFDLTATADDAEHLRSFAQPGGEFDLYDISVEWAALNPGPLTFSLLGGIRAIRGDVSETRTTTGETGETLTTYADGRGVVAVPVLGGGVTLDLGDRVTFRTAASTQTFSSGASYLDLIAETGFLLSPNVSLFAGYQFVESQLEIDRISTELDQEGVYARLQIRF